MDSLPNEIIYHILTLLTRNELLNIRIVSRKWNTFSLEVFNCSNLNIGFRNHDEVIEFCEMMKKKSCGLKFQKFFLRLNGCEFGYCELWHTWYMDNKKKSFVNWTQLSNEISSYVTEYYFFIRGDCEEQGEIINMILNNAPNLKILYVQTNSNFPKPNFNPLKKVEVLQLESESSELYSHHPNFIIDLATVVNWIEKVPSLKKLHCQFNTMGNNSSEMSKYFQYLQRIREVSLYVYLYEDHEKQLIELSLIPITKLRLNIDNANRDEIGHALTLFLKKQSGRLKNLHLESISKINNLILPSLPNLETFIIFENLKRVIPPPLAQPPRGSFLTFDPKNFINLRRVMMIDTLEVEPLPFIGGVYPTVTKLVVFSYSIQNWRNIFPNLRKFTTFFYDFYKWPEQQSELLKHVLAYLPTDHHLKLYIRHVELINYLIVNPSSVAKLEICLGSWGWNTLTGHARVEHDSIFCIEGVNNIGIPQEMGIQPSILNIKNLYKLRVWLGNGRNEFLKSISFLSQQKESFKGLKKMIMLTGYDDEHNNDLRKLLPWNFNTEIRRGHGSFSISELTFSREQPEMMMYQMYNNNYKKYAVKYVV